MWERKIRVWLLVVMTLLVWGALGKIYLNWRQMSVHAGAASIECGDGCLCGDPVLQAVCDGPSVCNTHDAGGTPWSEGTVYWENVDGECSAYGNDWGTWSMVVSYCPGSCSAGGVTSCGTYPTCGGACSGGLVCKAIAVSLERH